MRKMDLIFESITMDDVLRDFAGAEPKKHRLNDDPVNGCHGHDCFAVNRNVYHCFVCGDAGNVIQFVQKILNCDFHNAMSAINSRYHLWDEGEISGLTKQQQKALQANAEKRRQARRRREFFEERRTAVRDELERLTANKEIYAPKTPGEELKPQFVEACQKLAMQEYFEMCEGGRDVSS
ncbi:MAG: CHC2 zinc finger domain-containing protein [Pseudoramibacter sp.]